MHDKKTTLERVKPEKYFNEAVRLHREEIEELVNRFTERVHVNCVFCGSKNSEVDTEKSGFTFRRCLNCDSLFISPRLSKEDLDHFFSKSKWLEYWARVIYPVVAKERNEKIFLPRVRLQKKRLDQLGVSFPVENVIDIGAANGDFLLLLMSEKVSKKYAAIEPAPSSCEVMRKLGEIEVYEGICEDYGDKLKDSFDIIFMNSVIEHSFSLGGFFSALRSMCKPGGHICLNCINSQGLDAYILSDEDTNLRPPHVQNAASKKGLKIISEQAGLKLISCDSIGKLDVDLLYRFSGKKDRSHPLWGFSRLLDNTELRQDIQEVLAKHNATGYNSYIFKKLR